MSLIGPKQKSPDVRLMSEMRTKPDIPNLLGKCCFIASV